MKKITSTKTKYKNLRPELLTFIEHNNTPRRIQHILGVEQEAIRLAKIHDASWKKASVAALLHDCAKDLNKARKLKLIQSNQLILSAVERGNLDLVHAKLGSIIARKVFHIEDQKVLNAIKYHTTGRPQMSKLEKIIYIADFTEPGRKNFKALKKARQLAETDLDQAMAYVLESTIAYVRSRKFELDLITVEAYEYYQQQVNQKSKENSKIKQV